MLLKCFFDKWEILLKWQDSFVQLSLISVSVCDAMFNLAFQTIILDTAEEGKLDLTFPPLSHFFLFYFFILMFKTFIFARYTL